MRVGRFQVRIDDDGAAGVGFDPGSTEVQRRCFRASAGRQQDGVGLDFVAVSAFGVVAGEFDGTVDVPDGFGFGIHAEFNAFLFQNGLDGGGDVAVFFRDEIGMVVQHGDL